MLWVWLTMWQDRHDKSSRVMYAPASPWVQRCRASLVLQSPAQTTGGAPILIGNWIETSLSPGISCAHGLISWIHGLGTCALYQGSCYAYFFLPLLCFPGLALTTSAQTSTHTHTHTHTTHTHTHTHKMHWPKCRTMNFSLHYWIIQTKEEPLHPFRTTPISVTLQMM
jgi:hypothetical protein